MYAYALYHLPLNEHVAASRGRPRVHFTPQGKKAFGFTLSSTQIVLLQSKLNSLTPASVSSNPHGSFAASAGAAAASASRSSKAAATIPPTYMIDDTSSDEDEDDSPRKRPRKR